MRTKGGNNGCTCNSCYKYLKPSEAIKLKATVLSDNEQKARTGQYISVGKSDLCEECYQKLLSNIMQPPERHK